eukprot:2908-Eustigmatos_ZCMA.PRE.1
MTIHRPCRSASCSGGPCDEDHAISRSIMSTNAEAPAVTSCGWLARIFTSTPKRPGRSTSVAHTDG